jgi:hypothetical protein
MAMIDEKGRLFGKLNLLDLAVITAVLVVFAAAWVRLSAAWHPDQRYPLPETMAPVEVELVLPPDRDWLVPLIRAEGRGAAQRDARSGRVLAELLDARREAGRAVVSARLQAKQDETGARYYRAKRLVPGVPLELKTDACVVTGVVRRITPVEKRPEPPS